MLNRLLLIGLLMVFASPLQARVDAPSRREGITGADGVVRISYASREELTRLAAHLDVWEVHPDAVIAYITPQDRAWLTQSGFSTTELPTPAHPDTIPDYPCYRTIAELSTQLHQWASQYPQFTTLTSIGKSYEGRDLWLLTITNHASTREKPLFFLMANIHGRELITNEAAMVFAQYLLEHATSDADVQWLLDYRTIAILVSANPDGHVKNEPGQPWAWWRKNANPSYGACSSGGHYGIDLNRNSSFKWGAIGSSSDPCEETYRGPQAASESETQAIQTFMKNAFSDWRGPGDDDPASADATGIFITLHSYSNLVLWPWGHTTTSAPNAQQLQQLGRKLASFNGYTPEQASSLYPAAGTTDDWAYGELGIAAYTFEIGSYADGGFYPPCARYDDLIQPNLDAFLYAAKAARAPYRAPFGPEAREVHAISSTVWLGSTVSVQAVVDNTHDSNVPIASAIATWDVPPWVSDTTAPIAYPLIASDGNFDSARETVKGILPTASLSPGKHLIFVWGKDTDDHWGVVSAAFVTVTTPTTKVYLPLLMR